MDKKTREEYYKKYIDAFGFDAQIMMCIEEMSELTKELCKYFRVKNKDKDKYEKVKENIIEETADVLICAEQIKLMFGEKQVDEMMDYKIMRGAKRVEEYRAEQNNKNN